MARQIHHERAPDVVRYPLLLEQSVDIEEVTWMLAVERRAQLAAIQVRQRHDTHCRRPAKYFNRLGRQRSVHRRMQGATQNGIRFHLNLGPARRADDHFDDQLFCREFLLPHLNSGQRSPDLLRDAL